MLCATMFYKVKKLANPSSQMKTFFKIILIATVYTNEVYGRLKTKSVQGLSGLIADPKFGSKPNGYSSTYQQALQFGSRLWAKLQLCQSKTCTKCARIAAGYGKTSKREMCRRILNLKNCCPRTTLLTRGF